MMASSTFAVPSALQQTSRQTILEGHALGAPRCLPVLRVGKVRAPGHHLPLNACLVDIEDAPSRELRAKGPNFFDLVFDGFGVDAASLTQTFRAVESIALHEVLGPPFAGLEVVEPLPDVCRGCWCFEQGGLG